MRDPAGGGTPHHAAGRQPTGAKQRPGADRRTEDRQQFDGMLEVRQANGQRQTDKQPHHPQAASAH
ncbi:hypothetical protein D3C80_1984710 [compost metagenome]